jgi:hypothetical protein
MLFVNFETEQERNPMENPGASEWQAPPPPESIPSDPPQMSELGTVANIFFEPGRTFEDLKRKPRFLIAGIIIAVLVAGYTFGLVYKVGEAGLRRFVAEQIDKSPRADSLSSEQKANAVDMQMTISKYTRFAVPIFVFIFFFIGGLFYWLGAKAFGGNGSYMQNLSVWIYSGLPPTVIMMIGNFIVLAFKSADDIDLAASQRSLINANPGMLLDGKAMPVLTTLISTLDLFAIWGWILAAIGLRITNRLSSGSAWAIVILVALIGVGLRVLGALLSGNPS